MQVVKQYGIRRLSLLVLLAVDIDESDSRLLIAECPPPVLTCDVQSWPSYPLTRKRRHGNVACPDDATLTSDDDEEIRTILSADESRAPAVMTSSAEKRHCALRARIAAAQAAVVNADCNAAMQRPSLNLYKMQVS